jgi:hypothetical protein
MQLSRSHTNPSATNLNSASKGIYIGGRLKAPRKNHVFSLQQPASAIIQAGSSNAIGRTGKGNWK